MPTYKSFALPDLGEGLTEGEILGWLVAPGDQVTLNQPIVEVETAKAAVEIPSPYAGTVQTLHHQAGDTVDVGSPIITIDTDPDGAPPAGAADTTEQPRIQGGDLVPSEPGIVGSPAPKAGSEEKISVLVGTGPKSGKLTRRARKPEVAAEAPVVRQADVTQPSRAASAAVAAQAEQAAAAGGVHALAKPPVRKLARDLGIDLRELAGSGPNGTVTRADVEAAAEGSMSASLSESLSPRGPRLAGDEERIPIKGVRKAVAAAMVSSAFTAPHVTEFITVDVTPTMELVQRLRTLRDFAEVKVSPLLLVARALLLAVRRHPMINSSWDEAAQEIVVSRAVNLGIAAATPRGLVVPNIKDADALSLPELARALDRLVATARDGRTAPADMQRGTITITNVGVFGVDTGTPILNPGEAVILCFGAVRDQPWVYEGQVTIRAVTQLAVSFDHRIIDGQLGSQFLSDVAALLADPTLFAVWS